MNRILAVVAVLVLLLVNVCATTPTPQDVREVVSEISDTVEAIAPIVAAILLFVESQTKCHADTGGPEVVVPLDGPPPTSEDPEDSSPPGESPPGGGP